MDDSTNQSHRQRANETLQARGSAKRTWQFIVSTLRVKVLVAFLAVVLVPLAILAIFNYRTTAQALTNSANQALFAAASQTAVRLDAFITADLAVIDTEAHLPTFAVYLNLLSAKQEDSQVKAKVLDILQTFTKKDAVFISSYGLLDLKGRNVIDTDTSSVGGDESARDYFRVALETGLAYVTPVEFAPGDGKAYLYFSSEVVDTVTGKPVGVLRARYSAAILQQLVIQDTGLVGPQSYPILLDENGFFLADGLSSPGSPSSLLYKSGIPLDPARAIELEAARRLPPQPVDTLFAYVPGLTNGLMRVDSPEPYFTVQRSTAGPGLQAAAVTRMKTRPWLVAFIEPQETLLTPVRVQARNTVGLAIMIALVIAIAAIGAARLLTDPIVRLTVVARQVANGNLDAKAQVESNDEIGVLAEAFNSMTSRLVETLKGLRASEENYRGIFENAVEGMYQTSFEGRLLNANPALARILGFVSPDELVASLINVRQQLYVYPQERDRFLDLILKQGLILGEEFQFYRKDRQQIWVSINARLVRDEAGAPQFIEGFITDITERKRAEEEIRKLNEELEQRVLDRTAQLKASNKELEAFAYSISHDLRAPLRHIDGFLELLQQKTTARLDEQDRHYMANVSEAARRMGMLVDDLLSFSRMGRNEMSKMQVDLAELVQDVIQELGPEAEGRDVQWKISPLPWVTGDRAMLRIVLVNLLSNALKFTRSRSQAEIEIGRMPGQETEETIVFVRDNGVGFDMTYADKLFGVFQRLHRAEEFEGTGIGLANVHRIIARHGGRTWAEGKVGQGATFYFSLPQPN